MLEDSSDKCCIKLNFPINFKAIWNYWNSFIGLLLYFKEASWCFIKIFCVKTWICQNPSLISSHIFYLASALFTGYIEKFFLWLVLPARLFLLKKCHCGIMCSRKSGKRSGWHGRNLDWNCTSICNCGEKLDEKIVQMCKNRVIKLWCIITNFKVSCFDVAFLSINDTFVGIDILLLSYLLPTHCNGFFTLN